MSYSRVFLIGFGQFEQYLLGSQKSALNIDWSHNMWLLGAKKAKG